MTSNRLLDSALKVHVKVTVSLLYILISVANSVGAHINAAVIENVVNVNQLSTMRQCHIYADLAKII